MDTEATKILQEIRDDQRKLLEEYSRVANEALAMQKKSFELQQKAVNQQIEVATSYKSNMRLWRMVVLAAAVLVGFLVYALVHFFF